jgi:hypothetical protein
MATRKKSTKPKPKTKRAASRKTAARRPPAKKKASAARRPAPKKRPLLWRPAGAIRVFPPKLRQLIEDLSIYLGRQPRTKHISAHVAQVEMMSNDECNRVWKWYSTSGGAHPFGFVRRQGMLLWIAEPHVTANGHLVWGVLDRAGHRTKVNPWTGATFDVMP